VKANQIDKIESGMWNAARSNLRPERAGLIAVLIFIALGQAGHAEEWPQRPVKIISPYAAGGNSDEIARVLAGELGEAFGQRFIVENRPGASGAIAAETVVRLRIPTKADTCSD
jgi:tripartite-type tricarboxylate transporter receptor subunit TctC